MSPASDAGPEGPAYTQTGFDADVNRVDIAREYSYMRRVTAMLTAAAVVLFMATTFAQGPNFSGTWTRDAGAAPAGGGGGGAAGGGGGGGGQRGGGMGGGGGAFNCGMECTIVQDAKTLTIKRPAGAQGTAPADIVLNLSGVTKLEQPGRGGAAPTPYEVTAKVDGSKWVLSRTMDMQGTAMTVTQTVSIEGGKLTVVTTRSGEPAPPAVTATYSKK